MEDFEGPTPKRRGRGGFLRNAEKADQKLQSKTMQERERRRYAWLELSFANFREIN